MSLFFSSQSRAANRISPRKISASTISLTTILTSSLTTSLLALNTHTAEPPSAPASITPPAANRHETVLLDTRTDSHSDPDSSLSSPLTPQATHRNWSIQFGAAFITDNNIGEVLSGEVDRAKGDAGGQTYSLTLNWVAHRFAIPLRDTILRPQFEPYATLTIVDENGRSPFPDYNAGIGFRWVDFPWNKWLHTTFFTAVGLSYSSKVYQVDRDRHEGEDRSHLKLDWPIQLTFALPKWPHHSLVLYNDHQSGGHIWDEGGVNSLGLAYRFEF